MEKWMPIYYLSEKLPYEVSDLGQVRSVNRKYRFSNSAGKVMAQQNVGNAGYQSIFLTIAFKTRRIFAIHRLVASAFIPNPEKKRCVNHKDGNKLNNAKSNLEWSTDSENNLHAYLTGLKKGSPSANKGKYGFDHPASRQVKCTETGVLFGSMSAAAKFVGSGHKAISQAVRTGYAVYGYHFTTVRKDKIDIFPQKELVELVYGL